MFSLWLASIAAFSLGGGGALWLLIRQVNARVKMVEDRLRALQDDVAAICACQAGAVDRDQIRERYLEQHIGTIGGHLEAVDQRLRQIARRQDEQLHTGDPGETSYGAAIRLAHQGADVEQLVNTFGLSRGEAELIAALHRAQNEQK